MDFALLHSRYPEIVCSVLYRRSRQSSLAPASLDVAAEMVLADEAYVARLEHHYRLFKATLKKEQRKRRNIPPCRRSR